jgi:hypothetical protein
MRTRTRIAVAGAAALALVLPTATPGAAATVSAPIIDGLAGPLQLAIGSDGTIYVSQSFAGTLTAVTKKGQVVDVVSTPGSSINGVDAKGRGTVTFTTVGEADDGFFALVKRVLPNGHVRTLADVGEYEATVNPDQGNSYGFQGLTPECAAMVPEEIGGEPYPGLIDSNPYSVAILPGSRAIADAGGNDIVRVAPNGRISTIAVLPPSPFVVTAEVAAGVGLPDCTIGSTYNFEPVPTDVELGPDGLLYVSSLPGGPEDPSLGARGAVYSINPATGEVTKVADGFLGATNVAVTPDGTIYVAEMFGNQISTVSDGGAEPLVDVPSPAAVEWSNGKLYATVDVFGNGAVVTVTP